MTTQLNQPIVIEESYNAPVDKVWKALVDSSEMKRWYFDLPAFRPEAGREFQFTAGPDSKKYVHLCKVTQVVPRKKIAYSWRYEGYEGNSLVSFELFSEGPKTKVKLTHVGVDTFPKSNPDFARKNFAEGWTSILGEGLKNYLEQGD